MEPEEEAAGGRSGLQILQTVACGQQGHTEGFKERAGHGRTRKILGS